MLEAECAIRDLPNALSECIEHNHDLDLLFLADKLSELHDIMEYLQNDDNSYATVHMAQDDYPNKWIWTDKYNYKWIP